MSRDLDLTDFEYVGVDPHSKTVGELNICAKGARFVLPRERKGKAYQALFDVDWSEVVSFECCEVNYCRDEKSWPLKEELPEDYKVIGPAGMLFVYAMPFGEADFQVWAYIPQSDVRDVRELVEKYTETPSLPGLAHHATAAAVRYVVDHCEVLSRYETEWHDWLHKGPSAKPREKRWREKGATYVFCREGMAIDHYGTGEQLEQMSTFWPWRRIKSILVDDVEILYQWHEDSYIYRQQVWDDEGRRTILSAAENALNTYRSSEDVPQVLLIRPWSFPSCLHRSWDHLEPFASKASRNRFPPIYDFAEED